MLTALVTYAAEEGAAHNPLIPAWYDIIWSSVCFIVILVLFWRNSCSADVLVLARPLL